MNKLSALSKKYLLVSLMLITVLDIYNAVLIKKTSSKVLGTFDIVLSILVIFFLK